MSAGSSADRADQGAAGSSGASGAKATTGAHRAFSDPNADRLGASVTAYLVTGPVLYAALGGLADRWLGTGFLLPVGLLAGMAMSLYVVWLRYGKP